MGFINRLQAKIICRKVEGQLRSAALRRIFSESYGIEIGLYSYGCFDSSRIGSGTVIGRYCSFSTTAVVLNRNHGISSLSTHPYIFNSALGLVESDAIEKGTCNIGDDVWMGHGAIITPSVRVIGRGAIVASGAVVTKNVPPYAIVGGNPAKVLKFRFEEDLITKIEASQWWLLDETGLSELIKSSSHMIYKPAEFFLSKV